MIDFTEIDGDQARQLINVEQVYSVRAASERRRHYSGSMTWKRVSGRFYLYRKADRDWKSLGPQSSETEKIFDRFRAGRDEAKAHIADLDSRIRAIAPVNRAMRLGRMPAISAKLLRRLDREGLLGTSLSVVGTHALFAYERMAGVHLASRHIGTQDIDLLYDSRRELVLVSPEAREQGLIGILRKIDDSFVPTAPGSFRAANASGFLVDLIQPLLKGHGPPARSAIAPQIGDLQAAEIAGLIWLENSPAIETVVIDERGFPLHVPVPDPRAFALHKLWIYQRDDRDPIKRRRDRAQAEVIAALLAQYLPHLRFDDPALAALPNALRVLAPQLNSPQASSTSEPGNW
ncbi:MAG: hypothetical protein H0W74_13640 [Sphingosinicella sp.]|nr:hypothetical protein [Sphingosinicella sp.]